MSISFVEGVNQIRSSNKPISLAWSLSVQHMGLDSKINKIIEIIKEHENLFVNRNNYHNHFHFAEVVWGCAWLAMNEFTEDEMKEHGVLLLLAATFHDAEHAGRGNKTPYENEKRSVVFFRQWWKNNSLFLENYMKTKADEVEDIVSNMILATDFIEGQESVVKEYLIHKEHEYKGAKIVKLKKVLTEADILLSVLPQYGYEKTTDLLMESGLDLSEKEKWEMLIRFLDEYGTKVCSSEGAKSLKLPEMIKVFSSQLKKEISNTEVISEKIQTRLYEMFGK